MIPTKAHLRRGMLVHRESLPAAAVTGMARDFADQLELLPAWRSARAPAVYVSFGGEASTAVILERLFAAGRPALIPRIHGSDIHLCRVTSPADLVPGRFGIPAPAPACPEVDPAVADFILVPGVAFDRRGHRVGFGKGFYDRLLARIRPGTPVVGLAYGFQLVHAIPAEPHDRPMDTLVTPHEIIPCA